MPRHRRLDYPGALNHVMCRGINRAPIFADDVDRQELLRHLERILGDAEATCYAWALLPNHMHFLIRTGTDTLGHMMQRLLTRYAGFFNRRHGRVGHLFQNRFRSILGQEEKYFLALIRYIHLNPLKAGLVGSIEELQSYPWTGHADLMGRCRFKWMDTNFVLAHFGNDRPRAVRGYWEFLLRGSREADAGQPNALIPVESLQFPLSGAGAANVLGQGDFVGKIVKRVEGRDRRRTIMRTRLSPEDVFRKAVDVLGVTVAEVRSNSRRTAVARARALASKWLVEDLGLQGVKAAELLNVSAAVVSRGVIAGRRIEAELGVSLGEGG